ncbi:MarR family winged helix-turn-helix transcriptional regulator [Microbacterium sp. A84]|uniref:MarR family winged helix-turn-helix transcriptional regulator n=1 Tax=Microbacterium sp. A84 TaxID=3450715 RepID=UPI003F43A53C
MSRRLLASPSVSPDPTLRHVLRHVARTYQAQLSEQFGQYGISDAEYTVLFVLKRMPGLSSAEISRWTAVTAQAGNQIVKSLSESGLVTRRQSEDHGRVLLIELSPEGRRIVDACEKHANDLEAQMCEQMSVDERAAFMRLLRSAADGLGSPISTVARR